MTGTPTRQDATMMVPPTFKRVYPDNDGKAVIVCPQCEKSRNINTETFIDTHKPLKVECDCGRIFRILCESREFDRKQARLPGRYSKSDTDDLEMIRVEDFSYTGIKFRTRFSHHIQVGDLFTVDFALDNPQGSRIKRTIRVKFVHNCLIGAEFSAWQTDDTKLTNYLTKWQRRCHQQQVSSGQANVDHSLAIL